VKKEISDNQERGNQMEFNAINAQSKPADGPLYLYEIWYG